MNYKFIKALDPVRSCRPNIGLLQESCRDYISYSLNSLTGVLHFGNYRAEYYKGSRRDTRTLDYISYRGYFGVVKGIRKRDNTARVY